MNNAECNVVRDLMPLCIDGVASEESQEYVAEHIAECTECAVTYGSMKVELPRISAEKERAELERAARKLRWKRVLRAIAAGIVGMLVFFGACYAVPQAVTAYKEQAFRTKYVCENGDLRLDALYYDVYQETGDRHVPVKTHIDSFPSGSPVFELTSQAVAVNNNTGICVQYHAVYKGTDAQDDTQYAWAYYTGFGRMEDGQWLGMTDDLRDENGEIISLPVVRIELHVGDHYVVLWEEGDELQTYEEAQAKYEEEVEKYSK